MVSSFEFPVPGSCLQSIPATDVQECLFKQRRQGDSARANDDLNCDERSNFGTLANPLIFHSSAHPPKINIGNTTLSAGNAWKPCYIVW
jgi:hypothetical protein